ncbi:MAG: hypothetical protein AAGC46_13965 [Solirubrobacteraceae bacterium]|nr:hypothetical protein [Patulibacter sp.]
MPKPQRFQGEYVNHDRPEWRPILAMVGPELTGWFMWMGELELSDGVRAHAYKHQSTRRYLHIATDGRTFFYDWDGKTISDDPCDYVETPRINALSAVFRGWRTMLSRDEAKTIWPLVDAAWDVAKAGGTFEVDPQELELQRVYEQRQDEAEAA